MSPTPDDLKPHIPTFACLAGCVIATHLGSPVVANDFMVAAIASEIVVAASAARREDKRHAEPTIVPEPDRRPRTEPPRFYSPVMERVRSGDYPTASGAHAVLAVVCTASLPVRSPAPTAVLRVRMTAAA